MLQPFMPQRPVRDTQMKTNRLGAAPVVLVLLGLMASEVGCRQAEGSLAPEKPTTKAAPTAPNSAAALDRRTLGWAMGQVYTYQVRLDTTVEMGNDAKPLQVNITGQVQLIPSEATPERVTMLMALRDVVIRGSSSDNVDNLARQINDSAAFFTLEGGKLVELKIPAALSSLGISTYREIASRLQFARAVGDVDSYSADEYDATGGYVAGYERAGSVWRKHKTRYTGLLSNSLPGLNRPRSINPEIVLSEGEVALSPEGRPIRVQARDQLTLKGAQAPIHASTSIVLDTPAVARAPEPPADFGALAAQMERIPASQPFGGKQALTALDNARIHGLAFDDIVQRLEKLAKVEPVGNRTPKGAPVDDASRERFAKEDVNLFTALAATLRSKPETIAGALRRIHAHSPASKVLVEALGSASTDNAQSALRDLLDDKTIDAQLRSTATLALSRTSRPDEKSVELFRAMQARDPYDMQALYGLGTYASRFRDQGKTEQAAQIGDLLVERLRAAGTTNQLIISLRAVMNSGYAGALPDVSKILERPETTCELRRYVRCNRWSIPG